MSIGRNVPGSSVHGMSSTGVNCPGLISLWREIYRG